MCLLLLSGLWEWSRGLDVIYACLGGTASLRGSYACMMCWQRGHSGEIVGKFYVRPLFLVFLVFLCSLNSSFCWGGVPVWHLWIGGARHPGPGAVSFAVEVFNVGGWLTHGDLVLDAEVDFLAVVEHRLILSRVRGEWARLRRKGLATVWAPASQDTSHVGHVGVEVFCSG